MKRSRESYMRADQCRFDSVHGRDGLNLPTPNDLSCLSWWDRRRALKQLDLLLNKDPQLVHANKVWIDGWEQ